MNNSAKKILVVASLLLSLMSVGLSGAANAQTISLDGLWEFRFDSGAALEDVANPAFIANDKMLVPGCWDVLPQYLKQRGTAQYRRPVTFACNRGLKDISLADCDIISLNTYPGWIGTELGSPEHLREIIGSTVRTLVSGFRERYPDKAIIFSEMGTCGIYGYRDASAAQWTEEFQAEYVGDVLDMVMGNPETSGIAIFQFCDAPSYYRDGATVRSKPFAINLAGLYDQYRRPKLVVDAVRKRFLSGKQK